MFASLDKRVLSRHLSQLMAISGWNVGCFPICSCLATLTNPNMYSQCLTNHPSQHTSTFADTTHSVPLTWGCNLIVRIPSEMCIVYTSPLLDGLFYIYLTCVHQLIDIHVRPSGGHLVAWNRRELCWTWNVWELGQIRICLGGACYMILG